MLKSCLPAPRLCAALLAGLSLIGATPTWAADSPAQPAPQTAADWQHTATKDIEAAYQLTWDNHPGTVDPRNPGFRHKLKQARDRGLALATKVNSSAGYEAALQAFSNTLQDGHAGVVPRLPEGQEAKAQWPGFITVWRGQGLFVYASKPGGPTVGAEVLGCDGQSIRHLIEQNVFTFNGRVGEAGHWWVRARQVLIDKGNPFIQRPQQCNFRSLGEDSSQSLVWQDLDAQGQAWLEASYNGPALPVGLSEPRPGLLWMAMPSFQPDEAERARYDSVNQQIKAQAQGIAAADAMVIDLRDNQGGSSTWSLNFARALWGEAEVDRRMDAYNAKTEVWWRASPGNAAYLHQLQEQLRQQGQLELLPWLSSVEQGMERAKLRKKDFYVEKNNDERSGPRVTKRQGALFNKPVYVIVPGQCASACLDALDVFTRFPNTRLIGAPSAADSTYMEVRTQTLPSGMGLVIIPNKVYVNRPRANGETYRPAIEVLTLAWSQADFQQVIEQDLRARLR